MSLTRIGIIIFLLGLVMLPFSLRELSQRVGASYETLKPKDTQLYIILAPPAGDANVTVGEMGIEKVEGIHILTKVVSPNGETLAELNLTTPYSFTLRLDQRGAYNVYLTNQGNSESSIPVTIEFHGGTGNIERDRFLVNEVLLMVGAAFFLLGILLRKVKRKN